MGDLPSVGDARAFSLPDEGSRGPNSEPKMDICPQLRGKTLTLEPLTAAHAALLFPLLANEKLWRYTEESAPQSLEALRARYRRLEARRSPDGTQLWLNWAVMAHAIGVVGFAQATVCEGLESAEVAYVIAEPFWSMGFGTQAVRMLLAFVRDTVGVTHIAATVDDRNAASLRLLHKLGFHVADASDERNVRLVLAGAEPR